MIEYADLECPYCASAHLVLKRLSVTRVFRHFPVTSKHPRARVLAAAAEAAGAQGRFWEMHDSLLEDQSALAAADPVLRRLAGAGARVRREAADGGRPLATLTSDVRPRAVIAAAMSPAMPSATTGTGAADLGHLGVPSVWRRERHHATAKVEALSSHGMDEIEIPAYLRKQAD